MSDDSILRIKNAITDACREIEKSPLDCIQDIFNECFDSWETGLRMDHNCNIEQKI